MMTGAPHIQAVDAATGDILWDEEIAALGNLMTATGDTLLVAEPHFNGTNLLVARDVATGNEVWSVNLSDDPVGLDSIVTLLGHAFAAHFGLLFWGPRLRRASAGRSPIRADIHEPESVV